MEKYNNLTDEQIALICAKEIVEAEIRKEWDFSKESPVGDVILFYAYRFNKFLKDPDREEYGNLFDNEDNEEDEEDEEDDEDEREGD